MPTPFAPSTLDELAGLLERRPQSHPVELVVLPGNLADTLARWAGENAPAAIVTTRRGHHPRTLGRLTRRAAEHPGVSVLVLDPASLAAGTVRAA